jgi:hypothetical protein
MEPKHFSINVVYFGTMWGLLKSFFFGWDFKGISKALLKSGIGLMLIPMRGSKSIQNLPNVREIEGAWNKNTFLGGLSKLLKGLFQIPKIFSKGSKSANKGGLFSQVDKFAGMNYEGMYNGTILDWLLFGNPIEAEAGERNLEKRFPAAIRTAHSLLGDPADWVREIHPEMRTEYHSIRKALREGGNYTVQSGLEGELELIKGSSSFLEYLYASNLKYCVDTFHTFTRGSRDGRNQSPVVEYAEIPNFLAKMQGKVSVVHLRMNEAEVNSILTGNAKKMPLHAAIKYMYEHYNCEMVYEIYPSLFTPISRKVAKLRMMHKKLMRSFL